MDAKDLRKACNDAVDLGTMWADFTIEQELDEGEVVRFSAANVRDLPDADELLDGATPAQANAIAAVCAVVAEAEYERLRTERAESANDYVPGGVDEPPNLEDYRTGLLSRDGE